MNKYPFLTRFMGWGESGKFSLRTKVRNSFDNSNFNPGGWALRMTNSPIFMDIWILV